MKQKRTERPDAIIITFSANLLKDYPGGEKQIRRILEALDNVNSPYLHWGQTISSIPTLPVAFAYICFHGYLQYRMSIVDFERNVSKEFNDGGVIRCFKNKNWVNLVGPTIKAPDKKYPQKGFQGFRYTPFIF